MLLSSYTFATFTAVVKLQLTYLKKLSLNFKLVRHFESVYIIHSNLTQPLSFNL